MPFGPASQHRGAEQDPELRANRRELDADDHGKNRDDGNHAQALQRSASASGPGRCTMPNQHPGEQRQDHVEQRCHGAGRSMVDWRKCHDRLSFALPAANVAQANRGGAANREGARNASDSSYRETICIGLRCRSSAIIKRQAGGKWAPPLPIARKFRQRGACAAPSVFSRSGR